MHDDGSQQESKTDFPHLNVEVVAITTGAFGEVGGGSAHEKSKSTLFLVDDPLGGLRFPVGSPLRLVSYPRGRFLCRAQLHGVVVRGRGRHDKTYQNTAVVRVRLRRRLRHFCTRRSGASGREPVGTLLCGGRRTTARASVLFFFIARGRPLSLSVITRFYHSDRSYLFYGYHLSRCACDVRAACLDGRHCDVTDYKYVYLFDFEVCSDDSIMFTTCINYQIYL